MDKSGCSFVLLIALVSGLSCFLGVIVGVKTSYDDSAVIKEVSISKGDRGKYKYTTTQFDFVSDSVYQVGDTIKITRY